MITFVTPRTVCAALATAATLVLAAGAASAATVQVTIDFGTSEGAVDSPYTEDGFEIAGSALNLVAISAPSVAMELDPLFGSLTLTRTGGGTFSLVSFDYYDICNFGTCSITVGGTPMPRGDGAILDFITFSPTGLTNLTSLVFSGSPPGVTMYIDNIVLTYDEPAVVPVPAALPLLLAGLGGLGLMARRKRRLS